MESDTPAREAHAHGGSAALTRCSVRVRLRGGRTVQGDVHMSPSQSLVGFLATRKSYLNLTTAWWGDQNWPEEPFAHLGLRIAEILWVMPLDPDVTLSPALRPTSEARGVELHLVGGDVLRVTLNISDELRMSDYFESNPSFVPLWGIRGANDLGDTDRIAVNHTGILAIREV